MNTMDRYLRVVLVSTGAFTVVMILLYLFTGGYPETLTSMWFTYVLGECGVMGLIKCSKEIAASKAERAAKEEETKKAMAAMAAAEGAQHGETGSDQQAAGMVQGADRL